MRKVDRQFWLIVSVILLGAVFLVSLSCKFEVLPIKIPIVPASSKAAQGTPQGPNENLAPPSLLSDPTVQTALGGALATLGTTALVIWDRKRRIARGEYANGKH